MTQIRRCPLSVVCALVLVHHVASVQGQLQLHARSKSSTVVLRELRASIGGANPDRYIRASKKVVTLNSTRALKLAVNGFSDVVEKSELGPGLYYKFHNAVAKIFATVKAPAKLKVLVKLQRKASKWRSRLILLDAGVLNGEWGTLELAFAALDDAAPQVVRRSLFYLRNITTSLEGVDEKLAALDRMLKRYRAIDDNAKLEGNEWDRARLAFQSTMTSILNVDLPSAADYASYLSVRRDDPQLFDRVAPEVGGRTALTLFGAAVTGKNVAFLIDVSGSMLATDEITVTTRKKGKTVVRESPEEKKRLADLVESRRRITRAKEQLTKVIRGLPEGVRFNVIAYSTDVLPWRDKLTKCDGTSRKKAIAYIDSMEAEGVTVTDLALEQAFMDVSLDTIYLITDGAPTHWGAESGQRPPDADAIIRKIHRRLRVLNFLRGVRVFTLGFPDAHKDFLRKLAKDHQGTYTSIR